MSRNSQSVGKKSTALGPKRRGFEPEKAEAAEGLAGGTE